MDYFIGVDGGGSKTKAVLTDKSCKALCTKNSGPSNLTTIGVDGTREVLLNLIDLFVQEFGKTNYYNIAIGLAGAGRENLAKKLEETLHIEIKNNVGISFSMFVSTDAEIMLEGAFDGSYGCVLIAGTGSIAFAKDSNGVVHRSGGYGNLIGDEGSGYHIARKGLNLVSKVLDGRIEPSELTNYLESEYCFNNTSDFIEKIHYPSFNLAGIAKDIIDRADEGNIDSQNILKEEARLLIEHLEPLQKKFNSEFKLCLTGSLLETNNYYSNFVHAEINKQFQNVEIIKPFFPPEIGAVKLALRGYSN